MKKLKYYIKSKYQKISKKILRAHEPEGFSDQMERYICHEMEIVFEKEQLHKFTIEKDKYKKFEKKLNFGRFYNKGIWTRYERKIVEYYIVYKQLGMEEIEETQDYIYIDGAASSSPWSAWLRKNKGIKAYSLDLLPPPQDGTDKSFYIQSDITKMPFKDDSIDAISLQSALETFPGDIDINFIKECARVLKPGGKCVITPLYMNREYVNAFGVSYFKNAETESDANKYYRFDFDMPFTRLYDVKHLKKRICDTAMSNGLKFTIFELDDGNSMLADREYPYIYLHYFIEFQKI